jgi:pimeloyl-ACP methyl ester carboxylesterase
MRTTATHKYLQLDQVNLHYLDYGGEGPLSMLWLHGSGANAHWFDFVGPPLTRDRRVLAVDLRGHGDSTPVVPPNYTYDAYMADLRALLQAEHMRNPILLGHSMGGMLAVRYTASWPQEIGALVVCDARPVYSPEVADNLRQTGHRKSREYASQEDYIAHFRIRSNSLRPPQEIHRYIASFGGGQLPNGRWAHKIDRRTYAQREAINTLDYWQHVTCPALYLRAEQSPHMTPERLRQLQAACPHIECVEVTGAGHHLTLDQPEQTVTQIKAFLQRQSLIPA